ncbi:MULTISPECIES: asparagine synthase B [unclassified Breznakia]|uniref:asparagine synthase B n=1 Tax=unclassified Breznakia TaxID=2623764 RepID=UPI0024749909|nr:MULTISPECIES: asparagine synthase B [unclassified Breznakia]MDH6365907.1 asparagine synthase (glutamine-hydrolyzing) [Breznakia sp. PH1-1]MDH6403161.1 asparagine synthase (glutamine-hydrolyzing) [Breznakia sp. PF1-11]MDH6410870.1 asparagine synthase (glutamine-hydrolyzing) [Breznakia sp. PFB1-11]MDH6413073.1 asparagine synthase (glutamine-hydrolyzing) [Breznakia sp. PFB1-14]MDH6415441.1 asparagine synthase (glutamine-hydrolyzing) [Breznakia sp. PFB1-4]
MCGILFASDLHVSQKAFRKGFEKIAYRGPDMSRIETTRLGVFGFHRLAIVGLDANGMQPFSHNGITVMCNGELYGYQEMKKTFPAYTFTSSSDCELLIPLYETYGVELFQMLDAEFACVITDENTNSIIAARDPFGIRGMFYGYDKTSKKIAFASEAKALMDMCDTIYPFPPGHYYKDGVFTRYYDVSQASRYIDTDTKTICKQIHDDLVHAVHKRMVADAPVGYLLSGGLDSSLVCSIAAKQSSKPITTFSIGMASDAIDLKYARQVATYLKSDHHEVVIDKQDVIDALPEVIRILETWDITTIRASIGMYLLCKWIHENSDIKVLFTGEIADELLGYKYTDFAPNAIEFQKEAQKRVRELYMYDVLRADRCITSNSLEGRVPFGDLKFADTIMSIAPEKKVNTYNMGKYLLRNAFVDGYLPDRILFRDKAAFSDAVGHSLVDIIKEYTESLYTDEEMERRCSLYTHCPPYTKESLYYREVFDTHYKGHDIMIKDYWLPNQHWEGCATKEPSARVLSNYGKSGE